MDTVGPTARNARLEAEDALGFELRARVLEPSPPTDDGPYQADDPTRLEVHPGDQVVSPVGDGLTWAEVVHSRPALAPFASRRWLAAWHRVRNPPAGFDETRLSLHLLAAYVVAGVRRRANGHIGLRWTLGGFGTPFFEDDRQIRVEGSTLVDQRGSSVRSVPVGSLASAAAFLGTDVDLEWAAGFDVPSVSDPEAPLPLEVPACLWLGDWFGFSTSVLEELRNAPSLPQLSRVQLWPEHFDVAFEWEAGEARATVGSSPGDAGAIPGDPSTGLAEPYLYVSLPGPPADLDARLWNAPSFHGAVLPLSRLVGMGDQRNAALAFFGRTLDRLAR